MARRTFDVVDIIEILVHWHAGRNNSEIAQSLGVDRKTTRKYIAAAQAAGMSPGGPPVSEERWAELAREWFPELADTRVRQVTWPAIEPHHDYIGEQLKAGVTVSTIHQRLRDERGLAVSVASLRRYVAANLPEETRRSQVKVLRPWPAEPGAEAQIDYGRLGRWLDPAAGKLVTIWAFVMVLACSRHLFVRPVIRLDQAGWSECHVAAFGFFGGVPARLVPDNLKTGVDRPDLYDPRSTGPMPSWRRTTAAWWTRPARTGPRTNLGLHTAPFRDGSCGVSVRAGQGFLGRRPILGRLGGLSGSGGW
jgi:transposase